MRASEVDRWSYHHGGARLQVPQLATSGADGTYEVSFPVGYNNVAVDAPASISEPYPCNTASSDDVYWDNCDGPVSFSEDGEHWYSRRWPSTRKPEANTPATSHS